MLAAADIAVPIEFSGYRRFPVDGGLLLFDRTSGWNALLEGEETSHLRLRAPRVVQFGITNHCNLACSFCSRDQEAASRWTAEDAFTLLSSLAEAGVLEVAFGGGEPLLFPEFERLVERLWIETPLAVHVTTNGLRLDVARVEALRNCVGEVRLSLYDDNGWRERVCLLADEGMRFGVNWLVTPARLAQLESTVLELVALGCRDVLLLSYKGHQRQLHLDAAQSLALARRVDLLARSLSGRAILKLDICWGERMQAVPRLFFKGDCGAGREFVTVTSDRELMPCSFHDFALPFRDAAHLMQLWARERARLSSAASDPGCARVRDFNLGTVA